MRNRRRWSLHAIGLMAAVACATSVIAPGGVGTHVGWVVAAPSDIDQAADRDRDLELVVAPLAAGDVLRIQVPGAEGGKTAIGQLSVARATQRGYVTAYGCDDGIPLNTAGEVARSDLNYDGRVSPTWSNRLIVQADADGDICFYTLQTVEMIVDVNAVSFDTGITSFPNQRTDTRLDDTPVDAGETLRINVPLAAGSKTVVGQLTSARAVDAGFVTAYPCESGLPRDADGAIVRSDLNYDGRVTPHRSNRLIVQADDNGDICFYTLRRIHLVIDVNGVADDGIASFANRRTDTRAGESPMAAGAVLRVNVPEAVGAQTVVGQLTAAQMDERGFVTAFGCDDGLPVDGAGSIDRSDLNYDPRVATARSNRLVVQADADGDICFYTLHPVHLVIDVNGVAGAGITSFDNLRTDTRYDTDPGSREVPVDANGVPVWPPFVPLPPVTGVAALTGLPASDAVTAGPILAVKIDNYRRARPPAGLDQADAILEVNVEGVSRFIALFHSSTPPVIGPTRSARTTDLDLLAGMNRPIFAYSGANPGVTAWNASAARSGVLVDRNAQFNGCYFRAPGRPAPHNLMIDPQCLLGSDSSAGPARPLWSVDADWTIPAGVASTIDDTFRVVMDGVRVDWTWDAASGTYLRSQDGAAHITEGGVRLAASTVVELASVHVPSPVDARSPNVITLGTGNALIHRDGRAIPATWTRERPYDPFVFRDATGANVVPLDSGVTYLEFVRDR